MITEVVLPQLGASITSGKLVEWLVADGEQVKVGEPLFAVETKKAVEEVTAPASGILKQHASVGEHYSVGAVLGTIS